ncbi:SIS domain-containing protein [Methanobrevibacter filiformis]|uniref:Glutamine--fructose-6-phosphate aminotransferase n=1 Tax=Methanobrevibacter filiformis TaxID=55758 RepID=A0A166F5K0_9EURY|nr:SIS domain-containing protein [Methanobrevibacter filiformis]KZX17338.1 glutamine--fructose-6-phosphate aminotransferase [Methanobrevibacter filiformis]
MRYKMYEEILEQPESIRKTFKAESVNMDEIAKKIADVDKIYLIGCGSSLSTAYSGKDALSMISDLDIDVFTGYEFYYNKKIETDNSIAIFTSQSGETADTLAGLRTANELGVPTVSICNEEDSSMIKEATYSVLTRCGHEEAILGTKTYITQLSSLYYILFKASNYEKTDELIKQLIDLPDLIEELIKNTEEDCKKLAYDLKDEDIFYCLGSGPNFGLAYKLAMTMLMEGALKHACPLYSGEFRHGLIERAEKNIPLIFLEANFHSDELTKRAIDFSNNLKAKTLVFKMEDYADLNKLLSPLILVIPLEWFIYYLAHYNNEDPGSTRHIGKIRY